VRHALILMALNPALPLTLKGEIVTPAWLLANPDTGYMILTGGCVRHLERMGREAWLRRMSARVAAVRDRAKLLGIATDEERLRVAMLASSRANLDAERAVLRRIFPDTDHPGLASLMERARLPDEDVILLIGASPHQFVSMAALSDAALRSAAKAGVPIDAAGLPDLLALPRRVIFQRVDERVANFARCNNERLDEWADAFRVERRMPLDKAACILSVPPERWREPPRQQYVATLLELFEKRVSSAVGRGPLVRFVLGRTTPRLDLTELGSAVRTADALLNHLLAKTDAPVEFDASPSTENPTREVRLRHLISHAQTFRRDTGIDGRYLGFPFLIARDSRASSATRPRLAPVLLWPIALDVQSGAARSATLMFDRDREEVRLNPALENILGAPVFEKWRDARDELLARSSFRSNEVIDLFGALARPRGRSLAPLPGKDAQVSSGTAELVPAATLFNAEFIGQAVSEDLRQMRRRPTTGTALEAAIRVTPGAVDAAEMPNVPEVDRYNSVESDPSQDAAVLKARLSPGLLVEGPPGTGKSQTIVNMVADSIGRSETVLIVCQKQAALRVVEKRQRGRAWEQRAAAWDEESS
jgi:primosomal replication protein N''